MSNEKTVVQNNGIGALGILGIIFVVCKIFEIGPIAAWSWWWVLCPFWIGAAIVLGLLAIAGIGFLIALVVALWLDRK